MRGIKNVFYCVTHSPVVLGSMAAVLFTVALFLGLGHHGTQGRGLLYDSRGTVLCAFAIAAAVIGGASLSGGKGNMIGTIIGAFIIGILNNGLNLIGLSSFWQQVAVGCVIILAVFLDVIRVKLKSQ